MIEAAASMYMPSYARAIVYMLQSTEYHAGPYLKWYWRTKNFNKVMKRRTLERTRAAQLLWFALSIGMTAQIICGLLLIWMGLTGRLISGEIYGLVVLILYPIVWAHLIVVPLIAGRLLIARPKEKRLIKESKKLFANHPATIIAVAGSYGKTTMKELLLTVLSEGRKTAATPANKNVAISHAYFARKLEPDTEIVIVEYGEGKPGDVARFARTTHPSIGVITGLAPAHLDTYKTLEKAGADIFALADYLHDENVYVNGQSESLQGFLKPTHQLYTDKGVAGWKVSDIEVAVDGTSFMLSKDKITLKLHSGLLGRHQVGPIALAAALAHRYGLKPEQIEAGVAKTAAFEHRMQPRLQAGAWIIDDTYNGNVEGVKVGLDLLRDLPASRKIYITPGLVDQGKEAPRVHREIGAMIAQAKPDIVVLMDNSTTAYIVEGLEKHHYKGQLIIEDEPLHFYTNLDAFVAAGDVVLMQNDWTDNYA
jgi:UDP-N-acetylmuramoyl-tripeptide--D-alanyl-D-alanine ligase